MHRRTFLTTASAAGVLAFPGMSLLAKGAPGVSDDPLLSTWTGPHGGFPRFDRIKPTDIKPALLKAMDLQRAEVAAIAGAKDGATFANTVAALEAAGKPFIRASSTFGVYRSTMNDKPMQALEMEMAPILAAFSDEIVQNAQLFARIKAVYDGRHAVKLEPDQLRLVETVYESFARNGAALDAKGKARLKDINGRLASLYTKFSQNQLHDEETGLLLLESEADLAGLPDSVKQGAREAAEAKQHKGKWAITNTRSSVEPFLTYSTRRDLREKAWRMLISRGDNAGAHDNKPLITEILRCARRRRSCSAIPATPTGSSTTTWRRRRTPRWRW